MISFIISNVTIFFLIAAFIDIGFTNFIVILLIVLILIKIDLLIFIAGGLTKIVDHIIIKMKLKLIITIPIYIFLGIIKLPKSIYNFIKHLHHKFYISKIIVVPFLLCRIIFLNSVQYLLFVLIIWMFSIALFIKLDFILLQTNEINSNFFNSIGLVGILAGFFQYYIKRHEDKVQNNLTIKMSGLVSITDRETTFNKFQLFLENNTKFRKVKNDLKSCICLAHTQFSPEKLLQFFKPIFALQPPVSQ